MKLIKATAALLAIAAIVIGPPMLLAQAGWPLPEHLPGLDELWAIATRPPSDRFVLNVLVALGWVLWAALIRAFAAELWAQVRNARRSGSSPDTSARGPLRWVAAALIAAVVSAGPAAAALPADAEPIAVTAPADSPTETVENPAHPQQGDTGQVIHVVERGDTLWDIAGNEEYFDDPQRYPEIFEANEGVTQDDGRALEDEDLIYPGWELTIPITEGVTEDEPEPTTPPQTANPESESTQSEPEPDDPVAPSTGPNGDETEASQSPSTDTTSSLPEEDGAVPAPSTTGPAETPEPNSESEAPQTNAADTTSTAASEYNGAETLPAGLWLTAGTFLALGTGFSLLVFLRRRRAESAPPPDDDRTLTGRLADLDALLEDDEDPPASDPVLPLAVNKDRRDAPEASLLDWASDGLGLNGPGAHAVARAAIITATTSEVPVVISASAAASIGLDPAHTPAHVNVAADIDATLDAAEERIEDPVFDLSAGRIDLPPLLLITEDPHDREQRLTDVLEHDLIEALVLGDWKPAQLTIAADGAVTAHHPPEAGLDRLERCYIADSGTLNEAMTVTAKPAPTPTPDPEPGNEDDKSPEQPAVEQCKPAPTEDAPATEEQPRLILLGPPALTWQDRPVQWRRRRSLLLLAALAAPDGLTRDDLLETVVGDSHVDKARGHLGTIISDTRRDVRDATGLDIRAVLHDDQTDRYRLHPNIASDLADFHRERHLAATSTTDTERRDHLTRALACYGGDFATGLDDDWLEPTRAELRAAAYTTCLHLAALHRDADDLTAAISVLERACAIDRTRPDAWTILADTRTAAGDESAAEKAHRHIIHKRANPE